MGKILAGVVEVNITPPPVGTPLAGYGARRDGVGPSEGIHDELYAKALVLSDGEQKVAIVTTDLIGIDLELTNSIRDLAEKETGIMKSNILIVASHTHSGPAVKFNEMIPISNTYKREIENYRYTLRRKIASAIYAANKNLRNARIGVGKGEVFTIGANRRDPKGPMDPEVGVLRVDDERGNLMGVLVNYACHPTVMGADNLLISADFPGYAMNLVERVKGEGVIALFTNGAKGNISTRFTRREQTFREVERFGTILGAEVLKVLEQITTTSQAILKATIEKIALPFRKLPTLDEARRMVKESKQELEKLRKEGAPHPYVRVAETTLQGAEGTLRLVKKSKGDRLVSEIQVIRINDAALVGVPVELFVEIGLEIKNKSGLKNAYIVGLANDYVGYVVTREAYEEGMYESLSTRLSPAGGEIILDTALKLIAKTMSLE
ncbi:MAG: neutral/alkaline non-lysosomal ceramidase N-terminal domain-containing protein [Candidatus Bathyarchaeota archaeon]|nr:neutral/alkaline non-lysosomal ceramidase N-terminal domain-containing protein [Candidatus Bathyarchaeota archaeon]